MIKHEIHGLRMHHIAPRPKWRHITCGHHATDIAFLNMCCLQGDFASQTIGPGLTARKARHDMIDAHIGHFLRGLYRRANCALCLLHRADLAKLDTTGARCGRAQNPKHRLTGKRPDAVLLMQVVGAVKPQNQAGDLGCANVQNCDNAALHCGFSHGAHGTLGCI